MSLFNTQVEFGIVAQVENVDGANDSKKVTPSEIIEDALNLRLPNITPRFNPRGRSAQVNLRIGKEPVTFGFSTDTWVPELIANSGVESLRGELVPEFIVKGALLDQHGQPLGIRYIYWMQGSYDAVHRELTREGGGGWDVTQQVQRLGIWRRPVIEEGSTEDFTPSGSDTLKESALRYYDASTGEEWANGRNLATNRYARLGFVSSG